MSQARPGCPDFPTSATAFVVHQIRKRLWQFAFVFAVIVTAASCAVAVQYAVRLLVDAMATGGPRIAADAWPAFLLFLALVAVECVLWRVAGWGGGRTIIAAAVDLRLSLFRHLSGHAMRYFADHLAGALGGRITQAGVAFSQLMTAFTWQILPPSTELVGALIVFLTVDWRMAAALLIFVAAVVAGLAFVGARGRSVHRGYAAQAGVASGELVDALSNIWAVKAFSARDRERRRLSERLHGEAAAQVRSWLYLEKSRVIHDVALWGTAGLMLAWAIHLWAAGQITPGEVVMVSALTFRILHGSRDLAFALINATQQLGLIGETLRVVGLPHAVVDHPQARPLVGHGGGIEFEGVSFDYQGRRRVLEGFSLRIPPGQRVGLVGPSGAGKSTIVSLVQRLDDVQRGRVLIDGQAVTEITQDSLRAAIAVVPQEVSLFHRSILENIRYGRPDASDEEVFAAARAAYCDDFIRNLPEGYDTPVGERGVKLSGGQRQRLGLARAILKDAPILILDEATSALDSEFEIAVQKALSFLMRGRTVLAIAHRLSTLSALDRIVVLVDGRIVEDGSPTDLRRRGGAFEALWRMQSDGFRLDQPAAEAA